MIAQAPTFILEESLVILNPARDRVHLLDPSARAIWDAFAAGLGRDEIVAALVAGQGGNADRVRQEIDALLRSWQQEGLTADTASVSATDAVPAEEPLPVYDSAELFYAEDTFRLRDLVFRIRSGDAAVRQRVQALCGHLVAEQEDRATETVFGLFRHGESWLLVQDGRQQAATNSLDQDSLDQAVLALSEELTEIWHERREWLLIAHAAAVAADNACILLPGGSGSGKTTLAAALIRSGFTFLGDEIVPIFRDTGHATSQPFCLRIKQGSLGALRSLYPQLENLHSYPWGGTSLRFLPPSDFHQELPDRTWPITHIVFPHYERDAPTRLEPISPTEAFRRLLGAECLLGSPILPETVEKLVRWIQDRPAFTLNYSSLDEAVGKVGILAREAQG